MSDAIREEHSLSGALGALRSALSELRAPDDEPALRSAARVRAAARGSSRGPGEAPQRMLVAARARIAPARGPLALAATAAFAGIVVLGVRLAERTERAERAEHAERSERAEPARAADPATAAHVKAAPLDARPAFRPISFSRGVSPGESYSVVRVRLELASIPPGAGAPNAAIEADLLVGEDGLARAIRFDDADTLPVYPGSRPTNGERR